MKLKMDKLINVCPECPISSLCSSFKSVIRQLAELTIDFQDDSSLELEHSERNA